jgi:hypothetical protein
LSFHLDLSRDDYTIKKRFGKREKTGRSDRIDNEEILPQNTDSEKQVPQRRRKMNQKKRFSAIVLSAILVFAVTAWAVEEEKPLDNAQIIKMTKADLGDSVIIAKINAAKEVSFDLSTDELVNLKSAGVSKDVITAMLDRVANSNAVAPSSGPKVVLSTTAGEISLKPLYGDVRQIVAPWVGTKRFVVFQGVSAPVKTQDRRPSIVFTSERNPEDVFWLVKLDQDDDEDAMDRSIDVQSPGAWGGVLSSAPEDDFIVDCEMAEEKTGLWRYTPEKNLKPGEYALYTFKGEGSVTIFDFSVE